MDQAGSVPELKLKNTAKISVLIVEGEELVGAKQNRIVNVTVLVPGETETVLPVSCVEQGRWRYKSERFESGQKMMYASLRREHREDVKCCTRSGRGYLSDQSRIWSDISEKSARMGGTKAHPRRCPMFLGATKTVFPTTSVIFIGSIAKPRPFFAIGKEVVGLEGFGSPDTFAEFFTKLVKSYALDALETFDADAKTPSPPPEKARGFVTAVAESRGEPHPSVGLGQHVIIESKGLSGAALTSENRVVHLSVFTKSKSEVGYRRFSQRRDVRHI